MSKVNIGAWNGKLGIPDNSVVEVPDNALYPIDPIKLRSLILDYRGASEDFDTTHFKAYYPNYSKSSNDLRIVPILVKDSLENTPQQCNPIQQMPILPIMGPRQLSPFSPSPSPSKSLLVYSEDEDGDDDTAYINKSLLRDARCNYPRFNSHNDDKENIIFLEGSFRNLCYKHRSEIKPYQVLDAMTSSYHQGLIDGGLLMATKIISVPDITPRVMNESISLIKVLTEDDVEEN